MSEASTDLTCSDVLELIANDLDHELTETMHRHIRIHLAACEQCRKEASTLQYSVQQVQKIPLPESAGTWFAERTLDKLMAEHGTDSDEPQDTQDTQLELWEDPITPVNKLFSPPFQGGAGGGRP